MMLNKIISNLENLQEAITNSLYKAQIIAEATEMYNNGWGALEDGRVVATRGNQVVIKKNNTMVKYEMKDFSVNLGILKGNINHEIEVKEIPEDKKNLYLAQAIITKYYTLKKI